MGEQGAADRRLLRSVSASIAINKQNRYVFIFCLPEPMAQVSFFDQNFSVVRRRCRRRCRCRIFIFFSGTTGPFSTKLPQSILEWRGFKFIQMKGPSIFQGEIITK